MAKLVRQQITVVSPGGKKVGPAAEAAGEHPTAMVVGIGPPHRFVSCGANCGWLRSTMAPAIAGSQGTIKLGGQTSLTQLVPQQLSTVTVKQQTEDTAPGTELVAQTVVVPGGKMVPGSWLYVTVGWVVGGGHVFVAITAKSTCAPQGPSHGTEMLVGQKIWMQL